MKIELIANSIVILALTIQMANAQWIQTNGPNSRIIKALAVSSSGDIFAGAYNFGMFKSENNGETWTQINLGLPNSNVYINQLAIDSNGIIFAGASGYGVFRSINSGSNWLPVGSGVIDSYITSLAVTGHTVFAGMSSRGIFRSTDNGTTWVPVIGSISDRIINSFAMIGNNIFAGGGGVFQSNDKGETWTELQLSSQFYTQSLVVSSTGIIYSGASTGVFASIDTGKTWIGTPLIGLVSNAVYSLVLDKSGGLFACGGGVVLSKDTGATWVSVDSGLPANGTVYSLALNDDWIFAGTEKGIWRRPFSEMAGVIHQRQSQSAFNDCIKIYTPVATKASGLITFSLLHSAKVNITLYDLSGRKTASLINKYFESGAHNLSWDTRNLKAGMYMVIIQAGSKNHIKSIPIIR